MRALRDQQRPRRVQGTRQRLYHCGCTPPVKVRSARDDLDALCNVCGCTFELVAPKTATRIVGAGGRTRG